MNPYSNTYELKMQLGDGISQAVEKYDTAMLGMVETISRLIDNITGRQFYPSYETRWFEGSGLTRQWIDDLIECKHAYYSDDNGQSYIEFNKSFDIYFSRAGNYNSPAAWNYLVGNLQSSRNYFPKGQRSVKVEGLWGYHENRAAAWIDTTDFVPSLSNNAITIPVLSTEMTYADGRPCYYKGAIIKIDDEIMQVVGTEPSTPAIKVTRGINGSVAVAHSAKSVYGWQFPRLAAEACVMQSIRTINRAWQGFADGRATPELGGQVLWVKRLDPEVETMLTTLVEHI